MPSKTEEYLALAQRTANGLTRYLKDHRPVRYNTMLLNGSL